MNLPTDLPRTTSRPLFVFLLSLILTGAVFAASGNIDPTFNASVQYSNGSVIAIKLQADGKILVGGNFTVINGVARAGVARLNPDGTLDNTFDPPNLFSDAGLGRVIYGIGIQSDGKIVIAGHLYGTLFNYRPGVQRLNTNGSIDTTFTVVPNTGTIYDLEIQSDDKIVIGGLSGISRLNPGGSVDSSFNANFASSVKDIKIQPDGKILACGPGYLVRLDTFGQPDQTFFVSVPNNTVESIDLQSDGKIVIGGSFTSINGTTVNKVGRVLSDGSFDSTFSVGSGPINANSVSRVFVAPNDKIIVVGAFSAFNGLPRTSVVQLNSNGAVDQSFVPNVAASSPPGLPPFTALILADGRVLVGMNNSTSGALVLLNTTGLIDITFSPAIGADALIRKIIEQPDGKILAAGEYNRADGTVAPGIVRFNADGTRDNSFSFTGGSGKITAMALQPDGKILVKFTNGLNRLNANGTNDSGFSFAGQLTSDVINDIAVLPSGKIIIVGSFNGSRRIARLNSDGSTDGTFSTQQPSDPIRKIYVLSDGKLLIGGDFSQISNVPFPNAIRSRIARLLSNGSVDTTFDLGGDVNGTVNDIDVQPDGKVLIGGTFTSINGNAAIKFISRLNANGPVDPSFSASTDFSVNSVKVQSSGKIIVGGPNFSNQGAFRKGLERLNANGSTDTSFNVGSGTNDYVYSINLRSNGRILVGGRFTQYTGVSHPGIVGLLDDSPASARRTLFDYDGDGKADVSVFRPLDGNWYLNNSQIGFAGYHFGVSTDMPIPADFTGDGKADVAVFRPSNGTWYVMRSEDLTFYSVGFGVSGDLPVPADYDGDGKTDVAVYRPSTGTWYLQQSTAGFSAITFGITEDKPTVGDFDGDGKNDIALYRPSNGNWYRLNSSDGGFSFAQFGTTGDIPLVMDYEGDGKANLTVFRPSSGTWYIARPTGVPAQNYDAVQFGATGDIPVPGDYDGDGQSDIAVFRPTDGNWYLLQSTSGVSALHFGTTGDKPTPGAFGY